MSVEYKTPILSYANQAMPLHQRLAIRSLEQVTGRGPLYRRYRQYQKASRQTVAGVAQWDLAVETLGIYDTQDPVPNLRLRRGQEFSRGIGKSTDSKNLTLKLCVSRLGY